MYLSKQIIKLSGKNVFFEVMNDSFEINQVKINFIEYDQTKEQGSRTKQVITIYIAFEKFFVFIQDILSGRLSALAKKALEEQNRGGYKYCKEVYNFVGGTSAKKLRSQGKERSDKKSESRQLKITPGIKLPWIISAEMGGGEESETGLIIPNYNGKPEAVIRVPLSDEDLKSMALLVNSHINGYIASLYIKSD